MVQEIKVLKWSPCGMSFGDDSRAYRFQDLVRDVGKRTQNFVRRLLDARFLKVRLHLFLEWAF